MFQLKRVRVAENSMAPTLKHGDILITKKLNIDDIQTLQRDDIIVFRHPFKENLLAIKRIIGLPGENVQIMLNGQILINNELIDSELNVHDDSINEVEYEWNLINEFAVLGDNRKESSDSRKFGVIDPKMIISKKLFRLWPILRR